MGLIVGEGCFSGDLEACILAVALHASDPEPLPDVRSVFGGIIYGPYTYGIRHVIRWSLGGWDLQEALPYFRPVPPAKSQAQAVRRVEAQVGDLLRASPPDQPRDRPWFDRKQPRCGS
jgi:hypothetical protein